MPNKSKPIFPLIFLFIFFTIVFLITNTQFIKWGIDIQVLMVANILFFAISLIAFFIQSNALQKSNPNIFIRSIMAGMLIKMVVVVLAAAAYVLALGKLANKASIFIDMFLYIVYLATEVSIVIKLNKNKNA